MSIQTIRAAIEKHTGRKVPDSAVLATQYAFRVECFDMEGICVFAERVIDDSLYRAGIDRHGIALDSLAGA